MPNIAKIIINFAKTEAFFLTQGIKRNSDLAIQSKTKCDF